MSQAEDVVALLQPTEVEAYIRWCVWTPEGNRTFKEVHDRAIRNFAAFVLRRAGVAPSTSKEEER